MSFQVCLGTFARPLCSSMVTCASGFLSLSSPQHFVLKFKLALLIAGRKIHNPLLTNLSK